MGDNDSSQTCVVVGVGPGMGYAIAQRFAREGYNLALMARRPERLQQYATQLSAGNSKARSYYLDASDIDSIETAFRAVEADLGTPDVLVYNPAVFAEGKPSNLPPSELIAHFRVNVVGALACAQQVIPPMKQRHRGTILFTGGGLALHPSPEYASLAIGKAGLRSLAYSLGEELDAEGIHVATVTIAGSVEAGTAYDPEKIANTYWDLHNQPPGQRDREIVYTEALNN